MTTERELLEGAAKAVGLTAYSYDSDETYADCYGNVRAWNPLKFDEDALRLAVNRRFTIKHFVPLEAPEITQVPPDAALWGMVEIWREGDEDPVHTEWYKAGADLCEVTRRAIVRAAYEISKGMTT